MSPIKSEKELLERLAGLPREIPPKNDPWERIAARLGSSKKPAADDAPAAWWRSGRVLQAVAAAAVFGIAVVLFQGMPSGQTVPNAERFVSAQPALSGDLAGSEAEYRAAFREFIPVGDAKAELSALTVETIEMGWSDLRQVELELENALARDPADPFLNKRMLELRARQLGFLRQLAALDRSNRRLTI